MKSSSKSSGCDTMFLQLQSQYKVSGLFGRLIYTHLTMVVFAPTLFKDHLKSQSVFSDASVTLKCKLNKPYTTFSMLLFLHLSIFHSRHHVSPPTRADVPKKPQTVGRRLNTTSPPLPSSIFSPMCQVRMPTLNTTHILYILL